MECLPLCLNFPIRSCWLCLCSCAAASRPWGYHCPGVWWDRTHLLPCCMLEMQLVYQKSSRRRLYHLVECKICHIGTLACLHSNPSMSSTVTPGKSFNVSSHPSQTNATTTSMSSGPSMGAMVWCSDVVCSFTSKPCRVQGYCLGFFEH